MKKLMFALVLGVLIALALATTALADNGPHGSFSSTTDACANCHRAHTAAYGSNALLIADPETLCLSCHDGTGAGTNVEHGVYTTAVGSGTEGIDGQSLFGGGFTFALMNTAWDGTYSFDAANVPVSTATTSAHDLGTSGTVWGSGANNSVNDGLVLECTSCHDPHGNAGVSIVAGVSTKVASYRLLRWQPQGSSGFSAPASSVNWSGGAFPVTTFATGTNTTGWLVPDNYPTNGGEWYTIKSDPSVYTFTVNTNGQTAPFALGDYGQVVNTLYNPSSSTLPHGGNNYIPAAINAGFFCAQCHDRYFNNSRLRNAEDISAYCNGGNPATVPAPTALTDVSPIDPVYCQPYNSPIVNGGPNVWHWGDNTPSGDSTYMYRHASGDVRTSTDGTVTQSGTAFTSAGRTCLSCHVSHGTSAAMTATADGASLAGDSALLRLDNRAICLRCHANGVNYTVAP